MKNKKVIALIPALLFSTLGFVTSCGGNSSQVSSQTEVDGSITFVNAPKTIEKKATATIKVRVNIPDADDRSVDFSCEEDGDIITLPDNVSGVTSIVVTGKALGTATIKATSVYDKRVSATITIEVVPVISGLSTVWSKVITNDNYTLTSTNTTTETVANVVKVTEKAVTFSNEDGTAYYSGLSDTTTNQTYDLYGLGIDQNGYAISLAKQGDNFVTGSIVKSSLGLLTEDDFAGAGSDATSPNDVSTFYGLQAINPSWLTKQKVTGNVYEIEGTEDDENSSFVECLLWGMLAPDEYMDYIQSLSAAYFYSIADAIETRITANSNTSVTVEITYGSDVYVGELSDIGTTTQSEEINEYLDDDDTLGTKPALPSKIQLLQTELSANNYRITNVWNTKAGEIEYYQYCTPEYSFTYYPESFRTAYASLAGSSLPHNGYLYKKNGSKIDLYYLDSEDDSEVFNYSQSYDMGNYTFSENMGYLSETSTLCGDLAYSFSDEPTTFWSGDSTNYYYTNSALAFTEMEYVLEGDDESYSNTYVLLNVNANSTTITNATIQLAYTDDATEGWYIMNFTLDMFGSADTNDFNSTIAALSHN